MTDKKNYVLIKSEVPEKIQKYLKRNKLDFETFPLVVIKDLSQTPVGERNFGWSAWQDCDNFIEGVEPDDRGWERFLCKAYKGKLEGHNHSLVTDEENKKYIEELKERGEKIEIDNRGVADSSWLVCNYCVHYSPRTLEGRKKIAELLAKEYLKLEIEQEKEVKRLEEKIKENEKIK